MWKPGTPLETQQPEPHHIRVTDWKGTPTVTSCAAAQARRAPVLLLQRSEPIDVVGKGRRRRSRCRRLRLRLSPSTSSNSSNLPHLSSVATPVVAVVFLTPVSVDGPKSTLACPTLAEFSVRRSANAPTTIVLAIDLHTQLCSAGEAPFLDWHTRLPYPSSLIRL